ncbi:hemolysin family protein [Paracoccus pacificus]|uniref:Hemolysin family protein n=1 Tax=Paracoccus pacificus TaxID=1463598 RepID=A0ABW4RCB0_9RHOB
MWLEIAVIAVLTVVNGALSMSELAVVSSRPVRLRAMAAQGSKGAVTALKLLESPGKFLSAVQIGITLVGIVNGAVSGATLGQRAGLGLTGMGTPAAVAMPLGVGLVVVAITWVSLVVGELVPKQIAMSDPEGVAARVSPAMQMIARAMTPFVWVLDGSARLALWALGLGQDSEKKITDEEVRLTIAEATQAGVLLPDERAMIAGVMRVADRNASAMMTPRRELEIVELTDPPEAQMQQIRASRNWRMPVTDGDPDNVVGVITVRDLLTAGGETPDLRRLVQDVPMVLETADAMSVMEKLRATPARMVLVYDEYGLFQGAITAMDFLYAIAGDFLDEDDEGPDVIRREDGSWLVNGGENADEFSVETGMALPEGEFNTVAGMILQILGRIPSTGEVIRHGDWRIEIADMDGLRIDKVIVSRVS